MFEVVYKIIIIDPHEKKLYFRIISGYFVDYLENSKGISFTILVIVQELQKQIISNLIKMVKSVGVINHEMWLFNKFGYKYHYP